MKTHHQFGLMIAGVALGVTVLVGSLRSCNNYQINNPNLTSSSRATGFYRFTNKVEYTRLKDGSEEILVRDGDRIFRYQNLDGDDTVDRIRVDKYSVRDVFGLENILVRASDYQAHKAEFDQADRILAQERSNSSED